MGSFCYAPERNCTNPAVVAYPVKILMQLYDTELQLKSFLKILIGVQYHTIFSITGRDWIIKAFN